MKALAEVKQYLRLDKFPHIWCSGCGHGIILQSFIRAVLDLEVDPSTAPSPALQGGDKSAAQGQFRANSGLQAGVRRGINSDKLVVVSGIGCSSRAVGYLDFDTLHTAHGRSVAFATGIKMAKPEFTVVALVGDGDISAIGGNHLIHAARRNIDITVVVFNNYNYGMTGGQNSPTTRADDYTVTTPYGNIEKPFDLCALAKAAGATYIARSTTYHAVGLPKLIADGIRHHGFSLIEVITGCPTYYGRMNKMDDGVKMLEWQRDHAINLKQYQAFSEEEKKGKFVIGLFHLAEETEYTDEYLKIIKKAQSPTF